MTATAKPNFAVSADETPYRRLGAAIREKVYRYGESCYMFGRQVENGMYANPDLQRLALTEQRSRIYGEIEALLCVLDIVAEMKDAEVTGAYKVRRRSHAKKVTAEGLPTPRPATDEELTAPDPVIDALMISLDDPEPEQEASNGQPHRSADGRFAARRR